MMTMPLTVGDIAAIALVWFSVGYYVAWRGWNWGIGVMMIGVALLSAWWSG
jgi:hypothetical protein